MSIPPSFQNLINEYDKRFDDIIDAYNSLIDTTNHNIACEKAHGTGNEALITDISKVITDIKLLSIVMSIRHRDSASTAMEDLNNAIKLQKFAQMLSDMREYYAE